MQATVHTHTTHFRTHYQEKKVKYPLDANEFDLKIKSIKIQIRHRKG